MQNMSFMTKITQEQNRRKPPQYNTGHIGAKSWNLVHSIVKDWMLLLCYQKRGNGVTSALPFNIVLDIPVRTIRKEKICQRNPIKKKKKKKTNCSQMTWSVEHLKECLFLFVCDFTVWSSLVLFISANFPQ